MLANCLRTSGAAAGAVVSAISHEGASRDGPVRRRGPAMKGRSSWRCEPVPQPETSCPNVPSVQR